MPKFRFAFDSLKKFRENRLLLARKELAVVEQKFSDLEKSLRQAVDARAGLLDEVSRDGIHTGLVSYLGFTDSLTLKARMIEKKMTVVEEELDRHKSWVTHLGRELKIVEKLEEKQRDRFEHEIKMKEKRIADSWVAEQWSRREQRLGQEGGDT